MPILQKGVGKYIINVFSPTYLSGNYKFLLVMVSIKRVLFFFKPFKTGTFSGVSSLFKKWAFDFVSRKYVKKKVKKKRKRKRVH